MEYNEQLQKDMKKWNDEIQQLIRQSSGGGSRSKKIKRPHVPTSIKNEVKYRQNYKCYNCGRTLPATTHIHHKKLLSEGGTTTLDNLIALCPDCHAQHHHEEQLKEANKQQQQKKDDNDPFGINKTLRRMGF